ncbi:hypothetical protein BJ138DRAFT_1155033 [Hygrophoropsis aurantiaca]|uniref:Uncharacterized protein n=1 Tax=Hygrophoropsis aurantiaca TaxID=72124 RepID=A0ACB8A8Z6_9AGAM|nr:hypothetical protein BJ138DRAFT_1155033 [Hygrophoropsis aurantiaca]
MLFTPFRTALAVAVQVAAALATPAPNPDSVELDTRAAVCPIKVPKGSNWALNLYHRTDCTPGNSNEHQPLHGSLKAPGDWSCHSLTGLLPHGLHSFAFATTHPNSIYVEFFKKEGCHGADAIGAAFHSQTTVSSPTTKDAVAVALAYR